MIRNYLRSALRNITKHKFISFINLFGLTIGITCCLLILSYIINELSYDKFNTNAKNTYRVTRIFYAPNGSETLHLSSVAPPFGPLLQHEFPDIKVMTRVYPQGTTALRYQDKLFNEKNVFMADEHFFDVFSSPVVKGNPHYVLNDPYTMILTEEMAKKYFGDADPVNKEIMLDNNKHGFKVTGVFKAFPANSHFHPDILVSFSTLRDTAVYGEKQLETNFGNNSFFTYLLFPDNYNTKQVVAQFPAFIDKIMPPPTGPGIPATFKSHMGTSLTLQKLTDIHLRSHLDDEIEENGDINRVYIFSAIALFILLIACINYMNLSTARSALRAREIGIRKVIGAQRKEIIMQFLSESIFITLVALVMALALTWVLLPSLSSLSGQHLTVGLLMHWQIILALFALPFVIGLISGIYPALFMSSFKPVKVLKGLFKVGEGNISFRKVLVVAQFTISIILIVATTIVYQQLHYIQQKALGFNKEHMLIMPNVNALNPLYDAFRNDLLTHHEIKDIARSSRIPSGRLLDDQDAQVMQGGSMLPIKVDIKVVATDHEFIPTYGITMVAGRNFSRAFATDTANFIINEAAVTALNWQSADKAVGKDFKYGGIKGKIIGVMKDFHFESLHQKIIPLVFALPSPQNGYYGNLSVKIDGNNIPEAINTIQTTWRKYLPETPFEYTFLDDKFAKLYQSEQQQGTIFTIFSCIAIFIACLGLFGLSAFTITQRVKEIGVRKVLGASVPQIVMELSVGFLKLVFIAAVLALPIAWYSMSRWLQDFAFRIDISWWVFALAGFIALVIAFATISLQSVKAALANPVKSLRSE
jgi:putative ABC transport system permease protein